jgi:hypothetical protein
MPVILLFFFRVTLLLLQDASPDGDGIDSSNVNLSQWPNLSFILTGGTGAEVTLTVTPQTHWQLDAPRGGQGPLRHPTRQPAADDSRPSPDQQLLRELQPVARRLRSHPLRPGQATIGRQD